MNVTAFSALRPLAESLSTLTRNEDAPALRDHLRGRKLPALGGGAEPAEIVLRAIAEAPNPQQLASSLAPMLARVISECATDVQGGDLTPAFRLLLLQALQLAADLPADAELALGLERIVSTFQITLPDFWQLDPLAPPAARALVHQQTDALAEPLWYRLIDVSGQGPLSPQQRTIVLYAWRGLLYIPPDAEARRVGRVVNIDRIERGLFTLEAGVRSRDGGARLVLQALGILFETFPRSPSFWARCLSTFLSRLPSELQESVAQQWPGLAGETNSAEASFLYEEQQEMFKILIGEREAENAALQAEILELRRLLEDMHKRHDQLSKDHTQLLQEYEKLQARFVTRPTGVGSGETSLRLLKRGSRP